MLQLLWDLFTQGWAGAADPEDRRQLVAFLVLLSLLVAIAIVAVILR